MDRSRDIQHSLLSTLELKASSVVTATDQTAAVTLLTVTRNNT